MILDQVTLHDFGVYAGVQRIDLTPPGPNRPVVLFGGLNGAGKTTLMDALQLCLLGSAARCAGREDEGYRAFLSRCVHRRSRWGQASVGVVFRRMENGEEARYRVARSWKKTGGDVRETLEVTRNKRPDKALAENWPRLAEGILPANIAHLFFFDGEKVESYASPDGARELVATGIRNLLGMDAVERLQKDLRVLERRRQSAATPAPELEKIRGKEKELAELRESIRRLTENKAELRTRKLDPARRNLEKLEAEYRARGGEARDRRESIHRRATKAEAELSASDSRMTELADGLLPLALIADSLRDVSERSRAERITARARTATAALRERDAAMIQAVRQIPNSSEVVRTLEDFCGADLEKWERLAKRETPLNLSASAEAGLESFLRGGLSRLLERSRELLRERGELEEEAEAARMEKAAIPPDDSIAALAAKRDALRSDISRMEVEIGEMEGTLERLRQAERKCESEVDALWAENAEAELSRKDIARYVRRSRLARDTLAEFQSAVLRRQIGRVERLALESYQALLRKEALVSDLRIHPDSFDITLRNGASDAISPEELSAGERQLLAISLLWGMAKASGRALPVAIDTPMGRLDSTHRERLVERYFPLVSHQALLFSTDEEIAGDYLRRLRPHIGRSYRLNHDDASGATTVTEGFLE